MNRLVSWVKAHRALTALGVFLILWVVVSATAYLRPASVRTSSSDAGYGFVTRTMGLAGGAPDLFVMNGEMMEESAVAKSADFAPSPVPPYEPTAGDSAAEAEARIIKTGNVTVIVESVDDAIADLTTHAASVGGFVEHSSVNENRSGIRSGYVTMRVPVASFEPSLAYVRDIADFVRNESVDGQDVTEQYTDIEARLNNAREQEKAYLAILARANTVEDILKVQRELGNIRAQIESYEGRLKYLENRTSFSTITVTLEEDVNVQIPTGKFKPWTAVKQAAAALVNALQNVAISLIWTVILGLGLAIPSALVIWILWRIIRRFWLRK